MADDETEVRAGDSENQHPGLLRSIFYGNDGLRAGWCLLLFFALTMSLLQAEQSAVHHFHLQARTAAGVTRLPATPGDLLIGESVAFAINVFAAWIMSRVERRRFGVYGLGGARPLPLLFAGSAWGILALSLLVGTLRVFHLLTFDGVTLHGSSVEMYGAGWALSFLMVGFLEEFLTRGYIQYTLARGLRGILRTLDPSVQNVEAKGFWIAATLFSALLFMALHLHNKGETAIGIVAVGVAGLTFAYSLWRTGSLWWAIGFHAAWDWAQSFLFGVADSGGMVEGHLLTSHPVGAAWLSGGTTGPEGSILVLPTLLLVCCVVRTTLPKQTLVTEELRSSEVASLH